jgi:hypothetical protein
MNPFDQLLPLLVEELPKLVADLKPAGTLCALRLYYYDTHAPGAYLLLRTLTVEGRAELVAGKGRNAPFYIWASGEDPGVVAGEFPPEGAKSKPLKQIVKLFAKVYELLEDDEDEAMPPLRELLHEVARQLNARDWSGICAVSEDFVVAAADGSQFFADDHADLAGSIPAERLDLLRARRFLGPEETWDQLPQ